MSPRIRTITILASLAIGVLAIGAAVAVPAVRHHHGGPYGELGVGREIGRLLADLDLTDEQKTQVKAILKDESPKLEPLLDDLLRSKKALFQAIHADAFNEKAVRAAASGTALAQTELAVERARLMSRLRDLLTDEQRERLEATQQRIADRLERRAGLAHTIWKEHAADFIDAL